MAFSRKTSDRVVRFVTVVLPLILAACNSTTDPLGSFEPEITSAPDNFQLQATGVTGVSATISYPWQNGGSSATVDHSTVTSGGTAEITIRDANQGVVYQRALVPSLNEVTGIGIAGGWTIELHLSDFRGTLNFRVQRL